MRRSPANARTRGPVGLLGLLVLVSLTTMAAATPVPTPAPVDSLLAAAVAATDSLEAWSLLGAALDLMPDDLQLGNAYRLVSRRVRQTAAALARLDSLNKAHPGLDNLQVNLSLAHLDRLGVPTVNQIDAGILVSRAERAATRVIERDPTAWPALYARALARMTWPTQLHHARDAVPDLELCLTNLEPEVVDPLQLVLPHLLLGDAFAKVRRYAAAREVYVQGLRLDPGHPVLRQRVVVNGADLLAQVEEHYGLAQQVDTDLSPFWSPANRND